MGYHTDFFGTFTLDKPLAPAHRDYLKQFSHTRRMCRDADKAAQMADPLRLAVGLPIGTDGGYFVGGTAPFGQGKDLSVVDYNLAPTGQPGLWCQWIPTDLGDAIEWDGGEKFYHYTDWLIYIIDHFLKPWGYVLNGEVTWEGEGADDLGQIIVTDNVVTTKRGRVVYE